MWSDRVAVKYMAGSACGHHVDKTAGRRAELVDLPIDIPRTSAPAVD
jgi:hypothetical protein